MSGSERRARVFRLESKPVAFDRIARGYVECGSLRGIRQDLVAELGCRRR